MNNKEPLFAPLILQTETMVIEGISVRLNFSNKQAPDAFENIKKTLLQTHQSGKKIAQIQ